MRSLLAIVTSFALSAGLGGCNSLLGIEEYSYVAEDSDGGALDSGVLQEVTQIAAGGAHTCVLLSGGNVRCWGLNSSGQLGYGHTNTIGDDELPVSAGDVDVGGIVTQISAGRYHTCALLSDKNVRCWGAGFFGQLGYGNANTIGDDELPSTAGDVDVGGAVTKIVAGGDHTCALLESEEVRCWGRADFGQLGYGNVESIGDDELPSSAGSVDIGDNTRQIALGINHTCALLSTGGVRCWGLSQKGQLGYATTDTLGDNELPSSVGEVSVGGIISQLDAGLAHTCALTATGKVRCWGFALLGTLGYGNSEDIGDDELPSSAGNVDVGGTVARVVNGEDHTCALLAGGTVRCWGFGDVGRLGYGNTTSIGRDGPPSSVGDIDLGGNASQIAAGGKHTCALLSGGKVRCWGGGELGQLGYGNSANIGDDELPVSAGDVCASGSEPSCK